MDTLTVIVSVAILMILAAPIIEIAVKRPGIIFELDAGTRAFAEAELQKSASMEAAAEGREVPANDAKSAATHPDDQRRAA